VTRAARPLRRWLRGLSALVALLAAAGCGSPAGPAQFAGPTMGTTYHVTVPAADTPARREAVQAAIDTVLGEVDRTLSTYRDDSELAHLNRDASRDWINVSPELWQLLQQARQVSLATDGAFDITVAPLLDAWGFGAANTRPDAVFVPPTPAQIEQAMRATGHGRLELRDTAAPAVRKAVPGMRLTVDGIAPGHAVDRIAQALDALRYRDYMVEIGGEVRARGERPGGGAWRIAVEAPRALAREPLVGLRLRDMAVSTSGDYRDARVDAAGRAYSHTIDPRTGRPVAGALTSVTVLAPLAAQADAYATALTVMGTEPGLRWATAHGVPALFVERGGDGKGWRLRASPAFAAWIEPGGLLDSL
jgi:thiamine biosynthesis lipoprotein